MYKAVDLTRSGAARRSPIAVFLGSLFLILILHGSAVSQADILSLADRATLPGGRYVFADPGDITIEVNVWGTVKFPGLYRIKEGTKLNELVSLVGGVAEQSVMENRVERTVTIQLSREVNGTRSVVLDQTYEELFANPGAYPAVQDGDVMLMRVTQREKFNWTTLIPIANLIGTAVLIALRLAQLERTN